MSEARLIKLRAHAEKLRKPEDPTVAELEQTGFLWWFVAHREPDPNLRPPIVGDSNLENGFFKMKEGVLGPFIPGAIWKDENGFKAVRGFNPQQEFEHGALLKAWRWISGKPIAYTAYTAALEAGQFVNELIGHNRPPEGLDEIKRAIAERTAETEAWFKKFEKDGLPDQRAAEEAARRRDELNKLFGAADAQRAVEKEKPLRECQEIDAKWAFAKKAKTWADKLLAGIKTYGAKEQRKRDDAVRAQVLANRPVEEIKPAAPVRIQGAGGRAVPLPRLKPVCKVTNHALALEFVKDRPEIKAAVATLVQQLYEAGVEDIPGTKVERVAA